MCQGLDSAGATGRGLGSRPGLEPARPRLDRLGQSDIRPGRCRISQRRHRLPPAVSGEQMRLFRRARARRARPRAAAARHSGIRRRRPLPARMSGGAARARWLRLLRRRRRQHSQGRRERLAAAARPAEAGSPSRAPAAAHACRHGAPGQWRGVGTRLRPGGRAGPGPLPGRRRGRPCCGRRPSSASAASRAGALRAARTARPRFLHATCPVFRCLTSR